METTLQKQKKAKTGLIVAGVLASTSLILLNSNARTKVKDTSKSMKDSVNKYTASIKEDPNGTKEALITRVQNATEISKEAINKIQAILDTQAKEMKDTTKKIADDSKEVVSSAKDAKGDIKDVKDKALEAKNELLSAKEDVKSTSPSSKNSKSKPTTDHTITSTPVN